MNETALSSDELIDLVTRSGLADPEVLWQYLAGRGGAAALPADGAALAGELARDGLLTPFQAGRTVAGAGETLLLGKYRLIDQLGGASSSVYLADRRQGGPGKFAIKVLPLGAYPTRCEVERFRGEAEAMARLDHPGIVPIKEVGEDDGRLFLVMEYVEGKTLTQIVAEQGRLAPVPAARLIYDAALALAHVHQAGLVHRNLNPDHLMQNAQGKVCLLDLGLVRFLDDPGGNLTLSAQPDEVLGSVEYLAPEQVRDSHEVDGQADVYGLGAVLYFLLSGKAPFSHQGILRLAAGVEVHPQPLEQVRPDVPVPLLLIVERMMGRDSDQRYATAAGAAEALREWLSEVGPPPMREPRRTSTRVPIVPKQAIAELMADGSSPPDAADDSGWGFLGLVVAVALLASLGAAAWVLLW